MAPDFEKKREPRRATTATGGRHRSIAHNFVNSDIEGMLLMRCAGNSISTDHYFHHGNATSGGANSTVTGSTARSTITSSSRPHSARRIGPQHRHQQQQRGHQQQQQQQTQQQQTRSSSLTSLNPVAIRNSDDTASARPRGSSAQDICDNSNDSGLGFEERQQQQQAHQQITNSSGWNGVGEEDTKRRKMDIKLESEDANFAFPEVTKGLVTSSSSNNNSNSSNSSSSCNSGSSSSNSSISSNPNEVNKVVARNVGGLANSTTTTTANVIGPGAISGRGGNGNGSVGRVVGVTRPRPSLGVYAKRPPPAHQGPVTLTSQLCSVSRDGKTQLQIICQPEQQHRARYQTEGSRGAVKDRTGNGFPIVRLVGYDKPATLQVFIGTDLGRVAPHMFYQACRVSGKNSTPCIERKLDGTIVIEVEMDPTKDMLVTCDCVGILKERNVDVEHRFPQEAGVLQGRSKKKSTRCRMVFRATITHTDGTSETLQVCSQPIVCTQPPGIPEICKKSLTSCPCTGGLELFVLGKNFLKDTRVVFQLDNEDLTSSLEPHWECAVIPDKEFLQQTHLVCVVPAYRRQDLTPGETVSVKLYAVSSGKTSEPHTFLYTAASSPPEPSVGKIETATTPLVTGSNDATGIIATNTAVPLAAVTNNALIPQTSVTAPNFLTSMQSQQAQPQQQQSQSDTLKNDPSPPPAAPSGQVTPVMMWSSQTGNCQSTVTDVMMPPPNIVANPLLSRRSSSNHQLIIPDNLKTEVLDDSSENSMLSDNSMQSMPTPTSNPGTSPLRQLVGENSTDGSQQSSLIRSVTVPSLSSPAQEAVDILGVVDLMRNQHPLSLTTPHQSPYGAIHEQSHVKVLSPHHINKDPNGILPTEGVTNGVAHQTSASGVDLRTKHQQSEYNTVSNFTTTPAGQPLPTQSGQSIEKYLNNLESTAIQVSKDAEARENNFVGAIQQQQQRASIISSNRPQPSQQTSPNLLSANAATVKLDALVNSAAESHQMRTSPSVMLGQMSEHDGITSPQQSTRTSPPIPVKTMLLEALMPSSPVQNLATGANGAVVNGATVVNETNAEEALLTTINAALLPTMQETGSVSAGSMTNSTVNVNSHNPLAVTNEPIAGSVEHIQQIHALAQQDAAIQQQVQQVEQVVAQAQQQVEQVVAQAQQQAVQAVQQAQQQVVQQVVQHAQVVQQAVQQVQAAQQVQAVPAVQQAVQQATQEVQQAVQQATQEVVQQVQAVQQAVQQAQAAQAMQQAVQQDIGSMLNQPAGFVAEASSVLASGAAQEPCQQRLTNAAEQAINSVITNATQDIINNRPFTTTTAHAIIATKNILNSVATQSAQLMNNTMEGILPKSPSSQGNIVEQVARKSSPITVTNKRQNTNSTIQNNGSTSNGQVIRKPEDDGNMLPQELTSMSEHDLLSYINPSCFDPQGGFLM